MNLPNKDRKPLKDMIYSMHRREKWIRRRYVWQALIILITTTTCVSQAEDTHLPWGMRPSRNLIDHARDLPEKIGEDNVLWRVGMNAGYAYPQPTVVGDYIFVGTTSHAVLDEAWMKHIERRSGALLCFDRRTGELLWQYLFPGKSTYGLVNSVAIEGDRVYVMGPNLNVSCLDLHGMANGNQGPYQDELKDLPFGKNVTDAPHELPPKHGDTIWQYRMDGKLIWLEDARSGMTLIDGDYLWVPTSNSAGLTLTPARNYKVKNYMGYFRPSMLLIDKHDGRLVAQDKSPVRTIHHGQWSSPAMAEVNGRNLVFYGDGGGHLRAFYHDPGTRFLEEMWRYDLNPPKYRFDQNGNEHDYKDRKNPGPSEIIGSPVVYKGKIYCALGRDVYHSAKDKSKEKRVITPGMLHCIDPSGIGDVSQTANVWSSDVVAVSQSTPSIVDDLLFMTDLRGFAHCLDALTGEHYWSQDLGGRVECTSQIVADGKLYVCTEQRDFWILKAGKTPEILFRAKLEDRAATPAFADGVVYLVTKKSLTAYGTTTTAMRNID